jgi:hypothetical protein
MHEIVTRYKDGQRSFCKADLRWANLRGANLSEANLRGANLRGADLSVADLRWANLRVADLREADLSGADLRWAALRVADLRWANLRGADLREANLCGADLRGANLSEANLRWSNLRGSNLSWANLSEADLREADLPTTVRIPRLDESIASTLDLGGTLDMSSWHTCETTHCRAGWAITLAGDAGRVLEDVIGANAAAAVIYASSGSHPVPDWFASNEDAMADIKKRAGLSPAA